MDKFIKICVPAYDNMRHIKKLVKELTSRKHPGFAFDKTIVSGPYVHRNRNRCITRQEGDPSPDLDMRFDGYLFMDTDMGPTLNQVLKICRYDYDVVGAVYEKNGMHPNGDVVWGFPGQNLKGLTIPTRVLGLGTGLFYVSTYALEQVAFPWFNATYNNNLKFIPEDLNFCQKANAAGIEVWCDFSTRVKHHVRRGPEFVKEFTL